MIEDLPEQVEALPPLTEVDTGRRTQAQVETRNTSKAKLKIKQKPTSCGTASLTRKATRDIDKEGETKRPFKQRTASQGGRKRPVDS